MYFRMCTFMITMWAVISTRPTVLISGFGCRSRLNHKTCKAFFFVLHDPVVSRMSIEFLLFCADMSLKYWEHKLKYSTCNQIV